MQTAEGTTAVLVDPVQSHARGGHRASQTSRRANRNHGAHRICRGHHTGGATCRASRPEHRPSPDGKLLAFIRADNLWVREVSSGKETQLTTDGVKDFGYATDNTGWQHTDHPIVLWSPDSRRIATSPAGPARRRRDVSDQDTARSTRSSSAGSMRWRATRSLQRSAGSLSM